MNGKRHGRGHIIEYNEYNEKILECECLNGIKNGYGKEYNFQGEIIFMGEYLNGQRNGKGKVYDGGDLTFEGEYLNEKKNGKGNLYITINKNLCRIEGVYLNGEIL